MSKELSLSAVLNENPGNVESPILNENPQEEIGISMIQKEAAEPQTINLIGSRRPPLHQPSSSRMRIDPTIFAPAAEEKAPTGNPKMRREDIAYNDLDMGIRRKQEEYAMAMKDLADKDHENRIAIAEGLEDVDSEIQYNLTPKKPAENDTRSEDNFDENLERELDDMERNAHVYATADTQHVKIHQPGLTETVEEKESSHIQPRPGRLVDRRIPEEKLTSVAEPVLDEVEDEVEVPDGIFEEEVKETLKTDGFTEDGKSETFNDTIFGQLKIHQPVPSIPAAADIKAEDIANTDIDPDDFADIDLDDEDTEKANERKEAEELQEKGLKNLQSEILNKVINAANKFDVTSFKVSKKPASLQEALTKSVVKAKETASWPLMNVGRPYMASALTGPEIVMMSAVDDGERSIYASNMQQLKILYAHDENPYKPTTLDAWAKTIPYADIDNIFMAEYIATFSRANFIPYACGNNKCHNMELKDIPEIIEKMVKFKNDTAKKKFDSLVSKPFSPEDSGAYETVIVPINYEYSIGFKMPSIYNMLVELRSVNPEFLEKYASIVTVITYIDTIYLNDHSTGEFKPITYKIYANDVAKTFKSKIASYAKILNRLTNEYDVIMVYINSLDSKADDIEKFIIPEDKCSKCGTVIEEIETTPKDLVFTHQRLVDIATISTE